MIEGALWFAVAAVLYTYFGYALLVALLARLCPRPVRKGRITPSVTVVITAHNEEGCVREKIENTLRLDYPHDKLDVIVASDGSTDRTNSIVREYAERGVRLNEIRRRAGKTAAQNVTVPLTETEVLLLLDAQSMLREDALLKLVRNFNDPSVGYVSGRLRYPEVSGTSAAKGEGLYWRYELYLRHKESQIGSITAGSGAIHAVRRHLWQPREPGFDADFGLPLDVVKQGYRAVYEPEAEAVEEPCYTMGGQFRRKLRMFSPMWRMIFHHRAMYNPLKYGLFAIQMLSHRLLRYLVPIFLLLLLISNAFLLDSSFYKATMLAQLTFYAAAGVGFALDTRGRQVKAFYIPFYFTAMNVAALLSLFYCLMGKKYATWEKPETV